jgi:hypothetical protein
VLSYSTYLGGAAPPFVKIAVDSAGAAYVAGGTTDRVFPTTTGAYQGTYKEGTDAFVTKFNAQGAAVYSTYLGGSGLDGARAVAVDSGGNAYVTGDTGSTDFPTVNPFQSSCIGCTGSPYSSTYNGFVTKLNSSGSGLVYSTYLGPDSSQGVGIAVDSAGNAYVVGDTDSISFPLVHAFQGCCSGNAFVSKLNSSGSALVYSSFLGSKSYAYGGAGIALDSSGNAYIAAVGGQQDQVAVFAVNAAGTGLIYSHLYGGAFVYSTSSMQSSSVGQAIAVDSSGNAYITGYTNSNQMPTTSGAMDSTCDTDGTCAGGLSHDAFALKLSATGAVVYCTYLGGSSDDFGYGIAIDAAGNAYVTGETASSDFPTVNAVPGACVSCSSLSDQAFVTEINPSGSAAVYSTLLGGAQNGSLAEGIAVDAAGNAYIAGYTFTDYFPTTTGAFQTTASQIPSWFVTKISTAASGVFLTPASLNFGTVALGVTSAAQTVLLTNGTSSPLTISSIAITRANAADFAIAAATCSTSTPVAAGGACTVNITFKPSASGTRTASLSISDNGAGSPQAIGLTGFVTPAKKRLVQVTSD